MSLQDLMKFDQGARFHISIPKYYEYIENFSRKPYTIKQMENTGFTLLSIDLLCPYLKVIHGVSTKKSFYVSESSLCNKIRVQRTKAVNDSQHNLETKYWK